MSWLTDPYQYEFMQRALVAAVTVGVLAPTVGVWIVLRRLSYLGDAMAHSALGGIAIAVVLGASITVGAFAAGLAVAVLIGALSAHPRLRQDAVIGVVEVGLFATGVIVIGRNADRIAVNLDSFLFGQLIAVDTGDVVRNVALAAIALAVIVFLFSDLRHTTFDPQHAQLVGLRSGVIQLALLALVAVAIVVSLQTVGLLMSVGMLVIPAATARLVSDRLVAMTFIAIAVGVASAFVGLTASFHLETAPGASIALVSVACLVIAFVATVPRRHRHDRDDKLVSPEWSRSV